MICPAERRSTKYRMIVFLLVSMLLTATGFLLFASLSVGAQERKGRAPERNEKKWHQYAVKFVCGQPLPADALMARGRYFTAVNVHNPELKKPVEFLYKVAAALPNATPGPVSGFKRAALKADQALEIDCPTILKLGRAEIFLKGFVVILSEGELDVVAVYTAGRVVGSTDEVAALHMERVSPRPIDSVVLPPPDSEAHCPPGDKGDPVGGEGCCCNKPNPGGPGWPDCQLAFECRGNVGDSTTHTNLYSLCTRRGAPPSVIADRHGSQPPSCGQQ